MSFSDKDKDFKDHENIEVIEAAFSPISPTDSTFTKQEENAVIRKLDIWLIPLAFTIHLFASIDRSNIGNARVAGLEKDLALVGYQFNISLSVFYIVYACWEIPSNLVCKAMDAKTWISLQVIGCGIICLGTGFIQTYKQLLAVRVLLGLAEGGIVPSVALVLSRFYTRSELVFRVGSMLCATSLAGGFGGLLASGFIAIGPIGSIGHAWRNIFIFEGVITIVLGIITFFVFASAPGTAGFLTPEQRVIAVARLVKNGSGIVGIPEATRTKLVRNAVFSPYNWLCAFGFLTTVVSVQGVSLFLPTILKALYPTMSTVEIQLRTVPPFVCSFVWSIGLAYVSKRLDQRGWVMMVSSPFAIAGYAIMIGTTIASDHARYAASFLCVMGAIPLAPFFLTWAANNSATDTERAIASGIVPGFGQFGAIIAAWSYLPKDSPNFRLGSSIGLSFVVAGWFTTMLIRFLCARENKLRAGGKRDYRFQEAGVGAGRDESMQALGYRHPGFRFSL